MVFLLEKPFVYRILLRLLYDHIEVVEVENFNREPYPVIGKYEIGRQLNLFPSTVCPAHCSFCQMVTVHFFGRVNPNSPERLICNECGRFQI